MVFLPLDNKIKKNSLCLMHRFIMPLSLEKLKGHITLGLSVRPSVANNWYFDTLVAKTS